MLLDTTPTRRSAGTIWRHTDAAGPVPSVLTEQQVADFAALMPALDRREHERHMVRQDVQDDTEPCDCPMCTQHYAGRLYAQCAAEAIQDGAPIMTDHDATATPIAPRVCVAMRNVQREIDEVTERIGVARIVNEPGAVAHMTSYRTGLEAALRAIHDVCRSA